MRSIFYLTVAFTLFYGKPTWSQGNTIHVKTLTKNFYGNGSVAVGPDGTVFINEYGTANPDISGSGTRIFSVSKEGKVGIVSEEVSGAVGNTLDSEGNYYFNNGNSYTSSDFMVLKDGKITKIATVEGFSGDILMDEANGLFYITSYTHPVINKVSLKGKVKPYIKDERLKGATGIVFGPENDILVSNFTTGKIFKIDSKGAIEKLASIPVVYPGYVIGYITYFEEHLYATGYGSNKIYKIGMDGKVIEFAGSGEYKIQDGIALKASFVTPNGIDIDTKNRRLYITQNGNGKPTSLRYIDLPKK